MNQIVGRDGMELLLDQKLAGAHGWRVTEYGRLTDKRKTKVELVTQRRNSSGDSSPAFMRTWNGCRSW